MLEDPQNHRRITVQVPVPYWTASSPDAIHSVVTPIREAAARGSNQVERRLKAGVTAHHTEDDVVIWLNLTVAVENV